MTLSPRPEPTGPGHLCGCPGCHSPAIVEVDGDTYCASCALDEFDIDDLYAATVRGETSSEDLLAAAFEGLASFAEHCAETYGDDGVTYREFSTDTWYSALRTAEVLRRDGYDAHHGDHGTHFVITNASAAEFGNAYAHVTGDAS